MTYNPSRTITKLIFPQKKNLLANIVSDQDSSWSQFLYWNRVKSVSFFLPLLIKEMLGNIWFSIQQYFQVSMATLIQKLSLKNKIQVLLWFASFSLGRWRWLSKSDLLLLTYMKILTLHTMILNQTTSLPIKAHTVYFQVLKSFFQSHPVRMMTVLHTT